MTKADIMSVLRPDQTNPTAHLCLPVPKYRNITEYVRESQLLLWIWRVISEISCFDYEQYLRDGVILCQLIETLAPNAFGHEPRPVSGGDHKRTKHHNIQRFLDSCRAFGLSEDELFEVEDLLSMQDIPRVTKCLFALGKLAAEKAGQAELGKPYDEWLQEQLQGPSGVEMIGQVARRSGMPLGDDLQVSHVDTNWLKSRLEQRRAADAMAIRRPPPDPLVQRTPSKPIGHLKQRFAPSPTLDDTPRTRKPQINMFARW